MKVFGLGFHSVFFVSALDCRFPGSICKCDTVRLQMLHHTRLLVFLVVFVCYCHARFVRLHIVHVRSRPSPGVIVAGCVASRRCWIGMGTTISASTGVAALACASSGHHTVATQCTVTSCLSSTVTPWQEVILTTGKGPPMRSFCRQHRHRQSFRLQFRRRQLLRQ